MDLEQMHTQSLEHLYNHLGLVRTATQTKYMKAVITILCYFLYTSVVNFAFKGISADGSTSLLLSKSNIEDTMSAKGYNGDGVVSLFLSKSTLEDSLAFRGSIADGHTIAIIPKLNITDDLAFKGHIGRGDHHFELKKPDCLSEILLWTGYISQAWENPDNWQCGILPNASSEVIILPSALLFPQVNFDDEIKKLTLNTSTSIIFQPNTNFIINGQ